MQTGAARSAGIARLARHPIAVTTGAAIAPVGALTALAFALPLDGVADHIAAPLALAVPALGLLAVAIRRWPPPSAHVPPPGSAEPCCWPGWASAAGR